MASRAVISDKQALVALVQLFTEVGSSITIEGGEAFGGWIVTLPNDGAKGANDLVRDLATFEEI